MFALFSLCLRLYNLSSLSSLLASVLSSQYLLSSSFSIPQLHHIYLHNIKHLQHTAHRAQHNTARSLDIQQHTIYDDKDITSTTIKDLFEVLYLLKLLAVSLRSLILPFL